MTLRYLQANPHEPPPRSLRFHTEVTKLLRGDARCSSTFTCVGKENALAYAYVRCEEGNRAVVWSRMSRLTGELPADEPMATAARCLALAAPSHGASAYAWAREPYRKDTDGRTISVILQSEGRLLGLAGLERGATEAPFSADECRAIQDRAAAASLSAHFHVEYERVACELAAFEALGRSDGLLLMIDRHRSEIFWAYRHHGYVDWAKEVDPIASPLLSAVEGFPERRFTPVRVECASLACDIEAAAIAHKYSDLGECIAVRISDVSA